jgi:hypothetical protein
VAWLGEKSQTKIPVFWEPTCTIVRLCLGRSVIIAIMSYRGHTSQNQSLAISSLGENLPATSFYELFLVFGNLLANENKLLLGEARLRVAWGL